MTNRKLTNSRRPPEATHTLDIGMRKDQLFSGDQATDILDAASHFLTFVQGRRCSLVCPTGVDTADHAVWSLWSSPSSFEPNPPGWYGGDDQASLVDLFCTFNLVHKGRKIGLSADAYYEAWQLAVHYLELTLLAMLDYKGNYHSRMDDAKQPVPWST